MKIEIFHLLEGAQKAQGLTVIIDVFRAFTTACYVMNNHARTIIPVADIQEALKLKNHYPDTILMGERNDKIPPNFDFGNSPTHIENIDFSGKTVVHTTSAGTQGIHNAKKADEIITGSFVNIHAIIQYIQTVQPAHLSLVCMGYVLKHKTEEDTLCAQYIKYALEGKPVDYTNMVQIMRNGPARRFFEPANQDFSPQKDFDLCTRLGIFPFILRVNRNQDYQIEKIDVST